MKSIPALTAVLALNLAIHGAAAAPAATGGSAANAGKPSSPAQDFILSGKETVSPPSHRGLHSYEVCVRPVPNAGPLKAIVDGRSFSIPVGKCRVLTGRELTFVSLHELADRMHIAFTYQALPRDRRRPAGAGAAEDPSS